MRLGLRLALTNGTSLWSPSRLFSNGIGAFLDVSQIGLLAQDAAGTTPVTAPGQPVGLVRDTSGGSRNAIQTTSAARPTYRIDGLNLPYLEYDAVDDFMSISSFDWASDEVTIIAAVRKRSDATAQIIAEFGTNSGAVDGTFGLLVPGSLPGYRSRSRGTLNSEATVSAGYPAGGAHVVTLRAKISTDVHMLRVNGVGGGSSAADQGTGLFSSQQLFIGRRAGTSLAAAIDLYGLIAINRVLTDAELQQAERWAASRMGFAL